MTVIEFPPRTMGQAAYAVNHHTVTGTFRSPRGRRGEMHGILRVAGMQPTPHGAVLSGVFTAELREDDGDVIGLDSRRATVPAEVVEGESGPLLLVGPVDVDLMGITVHVERFTIDALRSVRRQGGGEPC